MAGNNGQSLLDIENIAIPIDLDAFTLCSDSCNDQSKILITPITRPAYIGLRLDNANIQHDVLKPVDVHNTVPWQVNSRINDLGLFPDKLSTVKFHRLGVYLHWSLPRLYRTSTAAANGAKNTPSGPEQRELSSTPAFRRVPNRWLVIRDLKKSDPPIPLGFTSWVIESDRMRKIDDPELKDADLEVDVSPFVAYDENDADPLNTQTEVFIGKKLPAIGYKESSAGKSVPLTIMNSSNPLFPDYTAHNANVFSTNDDFSYIDPRTNKTMYLNSATANYYVIGWHSDQQYDPLFTENRNLDARLKDLLLELQEKKLNDNIMDHAKQFQGKLRTLCHGAMYNITYDQNKRSPSAADGPARNFGKKVKMEPISVGMTAIDAVINFLDAHKADDEKDDIISADAISLANELSPIFELMYAANDDYDARLRAQDLVSRNDYAAAGGGLVWNYDGKAAPGGVPPIPSADDRKTLARLNEIQTRLDVANRQIKSLRWDLFAEWWKFVGDQSNKDKSVLPGYRVRVKKIRRRLEDLIKLASSWDQSINGSKDKRIKPDADIAALLKKQATKPTFYTRKDPTMCIAGLPSGRPKDHMDPVKVRLRDQLETDPTKLNATNKIFSDAQSPLPDDHALRETAKSVLAEYLAYSPDVNDAKDDDYRRVNNLAGGRLWGGENPFVPLFIEYELLYYHIDFEKWVVENRPSPFGHAASHVRYGISSDHELALDGDNQQDVRSISGRVIILPQPTFDMETILQQVTSNPGENFPMSKDQIGDALKKAKDLPFISAPLSDITSHLLTRVPGSHVKPNVRLQAGQKPPPGWKPVPGEDPAQEVEIFALQRAIDAADLHPEFTDKDKSGVDPQQRLDQKALEMLIQAESALTPYGNLIDFANTSNTKIPFKGVTHGQMMFRKLNIIDKFGQAIALPDPRLRKRHDDGAPPSLYPCLSDALSPSLLPPKDDKTIANLNTVWKEDPVVKDLWPTSRFMELGPSINQDARLNAAFVSQQKNSDGKISWQHTTDYDQPSGPVWGWIVINYADSGLQFFLGDGTFYREVRKGGVSGTNTSAKWLPFDRTSQPSDQTLKSNPQMDALISKMNTTYLQSFSDMINGSLSTMPFPPGEYSQFTNAIVGKPLALVNVGWSLELAAPALKAQNTLGDTPEDHEWDILQSYEFPVKIGDADRPFDGVVGYWDAQNDPSAESVDTDFNHTFSYFVPKDTDNFTAIHPSNFPKLSPTYIEPDIAGNFTEAITKNYYVTTVLMDAYTPIHGFSPILPIKSLQLPSWCIQSAFKRITAFFRLGPQLVTKDIPRDYANGTHATPESWLIPPPTNPTPAPIRLPIAGKKGTWKWLQPYRVDGTTKFNSLDVGEEDTLIRKDPAPYTFVEGYLQLAKPLLNQDIPKLLL